MKHTSSKRYWQSFDALPVEVQALANKSFAHLRADPAHPSLALKSVANGRFKSVRVGLYYRALGVPVEDGVHWFWIGTHSEYDKLVG